MTEQRMNFERQIRSLAGELSYNLTPVELELYIVKLEHFGLNRFAEACLEFRESGYPVGVFPSIEEFERTIRTQGLLR